MRGVQLSDAANAIEQHSISSLLPGEEMTCRSPSDWRFAGYECDWSIHLIVFSHAAALAFTNAAMFLKLSAMTPSPTHRAMPSVPW